VLGVAQRDKYYIRKLDISRYLNFEVEFFNLYAKAQLFDDMVFGV